MRFMADWIGCGDEYFEAGEYAKALECYAKVKFDPHAFERMGWIYEKGLGVEKDLVRAACLYGKAAGFDLSEYPGKEAMAGLGRILDQVEWKALAAADGGDAFATLGYLYRHGWGVEKDAEKALKYYLCAAEAGNEKAMSALGEIYEAAGDFDAALGWYERAENFSTLSEFWWAGRGGVQDYDRAFEYLRCDIEADRAGSSPVELGCMYECGLGVEKNPETAIAHYREALEWDRYSADMALWRLKVLGVPAERNEGSGAHEAVEIVPVGPSEESVSEDMWKEKWQERELRAAESGDVEAMVRLGGMYLNCEESTDPREAAKWFRKAAELGHAGAMAELGKLYEEGRGVLMNARKAVQWYRKAAELGNAEGMFYLGGACRYGWGVDGDLQEALKWYREASELGHSQAVREMCRIEAVLKAAEQGDAEAMDRLGCILCESGKDADVRQAMDWFRKSAELGHADAMFRIGRLYAEGRGVHRNDQEAAKWYREAAERGHTKAMTCLGGLEWCLKAAELGSVDAMRDLGYMYQNGIDAPWDTEQAFAWYNKAIALGDADSMYQLGMMYQRGEGVEQNPETALFWYDRAAAAGNPYAKQDAAYLRRHMEKQTRE